MPPRGRLVDRGTARGRSLVAELGREIEQARVEHGLTYAHIGRAVGLSRSQASRVCRGIAPGLTIVQVSRLLAVVGLELSARAFPLGPPIRDAAHHALLERFRARLNAALRWRTEVPLALAGDLRAWDARVDGNGWHVQIEAETRPRDLQALERRLALKLRDSREASVVLLLSDTKHNHELVRLAGPGLQGRFPVTARDALRHFAAGSSPGGSTIVFL
jgi:transcriptional regulator with XRE-family HTH domain